MPRRNYDRAKKGQVFAAEWPEWHVDCAYTGCEEHQVVAEIGEAYTISEAEKGAKTYPHCQGWKKVKGLWYCPTHAAIPSSSNLQGVEE